MRARWKNQKLINQNGLIGDGCRAIFPLPPAAQQSKLAKWVGRENILYQKHLPKAPLAVSDRIETNPLFYGNNCRVGEIAIIGSTALKLAQHPILEVLHSFGFLYGDELAEEEVGCGDVDIRFWVLGEVLKADLKKCLKGLPAYALPTLPED